jgi:hypothetical protein
MMKTKKLIEKKLPWNVSRYNPLKSFKLWLMGMFFGVLILLPAAASAVTLISQGYITSSSMPVGSIVSLQSNSSTNVEATTPSNANNILGVVIDSESSQVSISSTQGNQVQVATSGVEQVLVSNLEGNIAVGAPITASPINGVGMLATSNAKIVGISQGTFPNSTATKETYTTKAGQKNQVILGTVPVLINVAYFYKQPNKTLIPVALQNIADALAGKTVNTVPILICIGIFIVTMIVVTIIIYSMIKSSIISVGRNPMSQAAVYRNVIQLSSLVVIILGVAAMAIYLVLTKV